MNNPRERAIAASLVLAIVGSVGFAASIWEHASIQIMGGSLVLACVGFALALLGWARWILPFEQVVDLRDTFPQPQEERNAQADAALHAQAAITRRTWLTRLLYVAAGAFGLAALFPLGTLGPPPGDALFHSRWRRGMRLRRVDGTLVRTDDLAVDSVETVFPEGLPSDYNSMALLIRLPDGVGTNTTQGLIAYSKACTHAGCPVALYRSGDHRLVCPCHQSAFDAANAAQVLEGPADHPLPQLPLEIGADGYLRAGGDFNAPVGPGFWQES